VLSCKQTSWYELLWMLHNAWWFAAQVTQVTDTHFAPGAWSTPTKSCKSQS